MCVPSSTHTLKIRVLNNIHDILSISLLVIMAMNNKNGQTSQTYKDSILVLENLK